MTRSIRWLHASALLTCLTLTACKGGSGSSSALSTTSSSVQTSSTSAAVTSASPALTISGVVSGVTAVTVSLKGSAAHTTATDSAGNFSFATLAAGSYTVVPGKPGYVFSPVSMAANVASTSVTGLGFQGTANTALTYTVSGTVSGVVAAGVVVTLNGLNVGSTLTDSAGSYSFPGLVSGTYTVSAALGGHAFSSPLIVSLANSDSANNDFVSTLATTDGSLIFTAVAALPQATVGVPYSGSVVGSILGGTSPYHYQTDTLDAGAPPPGMILNPNGHLTGTPAAAGVYSFSVCATDSAGETTACEPTSITVAPAPNSTQPAVTLTANATKITAGTAAQLTWSSTNASACAASGGWTGSKPIAGTASVTPAQSTTYTLTCTGPGGSYHASIAVTVTPVVAPAPSVTLTASAGNIPAGATSILTWSSKNASSCTRSGGWSGSETTTGSLAVTPSVTTSYTLACSSSAGTSQATATVTVNSGAPTPAPTVKLAASPASIVSGAATTLSWSTTNATACTASGGWSGSEAANGSKSLSPTATTTYTVSCTGAGGKAQASDTVTVTAPAAPPATGTSWVYYDGKMDWPGDYSFSATVDYQDTSGGPMSGAYDAKVTLTGSYGGWLPYAQNWDFNSKPYTKLTFSLKPTVANQTWNVYFVAVGDHPVGVSIDPSNYGPVPEAGKWATYTVPLADFGVLGDSIYKFAIHDQTGRSSNVWYVDNVGFVP